MSKKKAAFIILFIISLIIIIFTALAVRESRLTRAEYNNGEFRFDGLVYKEVDYKEISPYTETWKVVCKTTDGSWVLYEIEQYPDHEYLVARLDWEARVIRLIT